MEEKKNGTFDYEKNSPKLVKRHKKKLLGHFETIQKLHEKFLQVREEGVDVETEQQLIEEDINYTGDITSKVCPVLDTIKRKEEGLVHSIKIKTL